MMVGPDVEATALVRHCSRLFVTGANLSVPIVSVVTRKSYGLGAQAMMGGTTKAPLACLSWPTGEFGGMGLEGAVRLGYRKELDAVDRRCRARGAVPRDGRSAVRARQGGQRRRRISRSTTSSTRPTPVAGSATLFDAAPDTHRADVTHEPRRAARTSTPGNRRTSSSGHAPQPVDSTSVSDVPSYS